MKLSSQAVDRERFKMDVLDLPPRSLGLVILECSICLLLNIGSLVGNGMLCAAVYRSTKFLCWIPMWSLSLSNRFYPTPVPRVVPLLVIFFVFLSSSINPLIYAATNNGFRQEFRKMLFCRRQRRQIVPRQKRAGTIVENIELQEHADVCRNVTYMAILKMSANGSIL